MSQIALLISRASQDISWLSNDNVFKLVKYVNHWLSNCDRDGNGLSEWNSAPHTGADTQFERVGVWRSCFCEGVKWAGIATKDQALLLVERHLKNPNEFWINYPIPSYALCEPCYTQTYKPALGTNPVYTLGEGHCNWCGGLWPHWEYLITHGLKNYGYEEEALYISRKFYEVSVNNPSLYEWYNAETGEGQGMHPFVAGISILGLILPLEIELNVKTMEIVPVQEKLNISLIRERFNLEDLPINSNGD